MWPLILSYLTCHLIILTNGQIVDRNIDRVLTTPQLIESRGYISETHQVVTRDGYILVLHRMLNPLRTIGKSVLMVADINDDSVFWIMQGSDGDLGDGQVKSRNMTNMLGFELALRGYDVWLGNTRGSRYSNRHVNLKSDDPQYWKFSYDEVILIDLPLYIDFILSKTGHGTLGYVGHALGAQLMVALLSRRDRYNRLVRPIIGLAPQIYLGNVTTVQYRLFTFKERRKGLIYYPGQIAVRSQDEKVLSLGCISMPQLCKQADEMTIGYSVQRISNERMNVYYGNGATGISKWQFAQIVQQVATGRLDMLDYLDMGRNLEAYGNIKPTDYDLGRITNKFMAIYTSSGDVMANPLDIAKFVGALNVKLIDNYVVERPDFTHIDFILGVDVGRVFYRRVLQVIKKYI